MPGRIIKILLLSLSIITGFSGSAYTQSKIPRIPGTPPRVVCYADTVPGHLHIPAPEYYRSMLKSGGEAKSVFEVTVVNPPSPQADTAAKEAVRIWASILYSAIPIRVEVKFEDMETGVLGSTGADGAYFVNDNGYLPRRIYHTALAEKLIGQNLNGNSPDIYVSMNTDYSWYYGIDGEPGGQNDFLTILIHEIAHGLGFIGGLVVDNDGKGWNAYNGITVYDHFVEDVQGRQLANPLIFAQGSLALGTALISSPVYFKSPLALQQLSEIPKLYVPNPWNPGSSLYHLDQIYNDGINALMTYSSGAGEVIHDPGPITTMMFYDMGWLHTYIEHDSLLDRESLVDPFTVTARMFGDTLLALQSQYLFYSFNNRLSFDYIAMTPSGNPDEYSADIPVSASGLYIDYYITTLDTLYRKYTLPAEAPQNTYRFYVGTDTISPTIEHSPISFMLVSNDSVEISARIWDNLGIDVAQVEYRINEADQTPISLSQDSLGEYRGHFIFTPGQLVAGDVIKYRISVVDGSLARHTVYNPEIGYHTFNVEDVPPYQDQYQNDFELESDMDDFLITGTFKREKPAGFNSWALHSDHPYPSPEKNDTYYNFYAQLKVPIRLSAENPWMIFDEVAFIEPGEPGSIYGADDFWDYVIIEFSKDGSTWKDLGVGYDCRNATEWVTAWNAALYTGNTNMAVATEAHIKTKMIKLLTTFGSLQAGDIILIRFHLHADPYSNGWGWMIDNLNLQVPGLSSRDFPIEPATISVYPNPSTGLVNVSLQMKERVEELHILVMDLLGRQIISENYSYPGQEFSKQFDLNDLPNGIYMMQFRTGNQRVMKKIILAR